MEDNVAIKVSGLGKKYTIGKEKDGSLRSTLSSVFKSSASKGADFWALKNVDFEIKKGEVVGIIGKNGAGKSTLLKVLSQITKPTEGRIEINGRVASLLEVGTGFHPELTGRENIFLNGTILGMSRKEVKAKFDEIVEFSGVQKFIDTPVKHYSSGMYVRLAFAVAAHLEPEILIIDEVLAVGDAEFQKKCLGKMKDVAGEGRTVIFVSHDMRAINNLCERAVLLDQGNITFNGEIKKAIEIYSFGGKGFNDLNLLNHPRDKKINDNFMFSKLSIRNKKNTNTLLSKEEIHMEISFINKAPIKNIAFGFNITDHENHNLIECRSFRQLTNLDIIDTGEHTVSVSFIPNLNNGTYSLNLGAVSKDGNLDYIQSAYMLELKNELHEDSWYNEDIGKFIVKHQWEML